ncbi:hypothetical protein, partial [Nonomuraea basaltis]|uniref:hypothetical protein n=1 Tax=Nonomuraea basaltis TaxID=2495887 RepID=UPI00197F9BC1
MSGLVSSLGSLVASSCGHWSRGQAEGCVVVSGAVGVGEADGQSSGGSASSAADGHGAFSYTHL